PGPAHARGIRPPDRSPSSRRGCRQRRQGIVSGMSAAYRVLLVNASIACRDLLQQWLQGQDMVLDDSIAAERLIPSIARRPPDLIVLGIDDDLAIAAQTCDLLKTNPATMLLPVLGVSHAPQRRLAAIEAG